MKKTILYQLILMCFTFIATTSIAQERHMEYLDRSLLAIKINNGVYLNWRLQGNEKVATFNVYKNGELLAFIANTEATNFTDPIGTITDKYKVKAVINGIEESIGSKEMTPWSQQYMTMQLNRPESGVTPPNYVRTGGDPIIFENGQNYTYFPDDCSVGDLDGDGEYEIIVKWNPSNSKDNSQAGITGPVFIDAYKLDGTQLWRISLGKNIRAGAHYTQFLVYDFDGDGKAEIVCKTAPGTKDGKGNNVILGSDEPDADYRHLELNSFCGLILEGPEYLTMFDGQTGEELHSVPYEIPRGEVLSWGDNYGNRSDRFLAAVAYLDGIHPSFVMCRGYYMKTTLVAYDFIDGKIVKRWEHISDIEGQGIYGQGNHNLSVADVDEDGFDEIIYGSAAINHDGATLYRTRMGHGDAMHISDLDPDRPGLEVWQVLESAPAINKYGYELHDARTGEIIWGSPTYKDNGRGVAADIDPKHRGFEMWSAVGVGTYNCRGEQISTNKPSLRFRVYWDGDLQDELLDGNAITKWNGYGIYNMYTFFGVGANSFPNISADILGDWREEVVKYDAADPSKLRIYSTTWPTEYRLYTLMHDPVYRLGIAWQNIAYNQPPHLGFYIGCGIENIPWPKMYTSLTTSNTEIIKNGGTISGYIDKNDILTINSESNLKSVSVYTLDGVLIENLNEINNSTTQLQLAHFDSPTVLIIRVISNEQTRSLKVITGITN